MRINCKLGSILLGITLFFGGLISPVFSQVSTAEKDALMSLYNATGGPSWTHDDNWGTTCPGEQLVRGHGQWRQSGAAQSEG